MILGKIVGRSSTVGFQFSVSGNAKKFQYVQVLDEGGNYILGQIVEIERDSVDIIADCVIFGYRDNGKLRGLLRPLVPGTEVLLAEEELIASTLGLNKEEKSGYIGLLDGYDNIKVNLDLNNVITKHVCILAKSGSGKSYCSAVLLEELLDRKVPIVVIDPHGEYSSLRLPNNQDKEAMLKFGVKSKGYLSSVQEYTPSPEINTEARPLKLSLHGVTPSGLAHLLPAKLGNAQMTCLYSALKDSEVVDFDQLLIELHNVDNPGKWSLISILEYVKKLGIFSDYATPVSELVVPGKISVVNLKGTSQELQEVIVYKLLNDMFRERKLGNIPPFFLVLEECHNFVPERNFKEAKSSGIIRQIFAEGRKFGLGGCLISQRPSRVDKSDLSQCTTQIVLKVTNPNDVKAIVNSVEGITSETAGAIKNLPIGTSLVTGVVDSPLFVQMRPRKTKHGGEAVDILKEGVLVSEDNAGLMPLIMQQVSKEDIELMEDQVEVKTGLIPCGLYSCGDFNLLVNLVNGELVNDLETARGVSLDFGEVKMSPSEARVFSIGLKLGQFTSSELFAKSGLQFSEIYDIVQMLVNKNFFIKDQGKYKVSEGFDVFKNLEKYSCFSKVVYKDVEYDKKFDAKYALGDFSKVLGKYVGITNQKECFLVIYQTMKKN